MHYRRMFEYLETHDATFYRMEDFPRLQGTTDTKEKALDERRLRQFQDAVTKHVIEPHRAFFAQYYEDLSLGA